MMENQEKFGLLLFLLAHFGEINGRTRIQKMLYLTNQIGWNVYKDYHFYQFGPYSQWLKRALDLVVKHKLVEEKQEEIDEDKFIYKYKITEYGIKYLKKINLEPSELVEKTKTFFDTLKAYRTDDLEIMTSLYHLKKSDPDEKTDEKLIQFIKLYKPRFNEKQIEKNLEVFPLMEPFTRN